LSKAFRFDMLPTHAVTHVLLTTLDLGSLLLA
jgi:hypothetical protein